MTALARICHFNPPTPPHGALAEPAGAIDFQELVGAAKSLTSMHKVVKLLIGLGLLIPGALSLYTFVDPEMPVRLAFQNPGVSDPLGTLLRRWFEFADYLQKANTSDYLGILFLCFGLTVAGLFTCAKALK